MTPLWWIWLYLANGTFWSIFHNKFWWRYKSRAIWRHPTVAMLLVHVMLWITHVIIHCSLTWSHRETARLLRVLSSHWQIQGGPIGSPAPPPTGPNSFLFTYVSAKKCPCRRLATTQCIGGSRGALPASPPPTGSISFIFTYIFTKKCMRWRLAPPQWVSTPPNGKSWIRHCPNGSAPPPWEILDPPLVTIPWPNGESYLNLLCHNEI